MLYCCLNAGVYRTEDSRDILLAFYQGVVGTWSFPHESAMVQTRHGETHVITAGDKSRPALVLLHGAAANVLGWGAAMPEYMRDFFVIAPDIPGEAGRSAPEPCRVLMIRGGEDAFFNAAKAGACLKKMLPGSEVYIEIRGEHGITEYGGRIASFLAVP